MASSQPPSLVGATLLGSNLLLRVRWVNVNRYWVVFFTIAVYPMFPTVVQTVIQTMMLQKWSLLTQFQFQMLNLGNNSTHCGASPILEESKSTKMCSNLTISFFLSWEDGPHLLEPLIGPLQVYGELKIYSPDAKKGRQIYRATPHHLSWTRDLRGSRTGTWLSTRIYSSILTGLIAL